MNREFSFLKNYDGKVKLNNSLASEEQLEELDLLKDSEITLELIPKSYIKIYYKIYVRSWMSGDSGNLDFHQRWNNGVSMPTREIICEILGESPGMFKVDGKCSNGEHWTGYISKAAIIEKQEVEDEFFS